MAWTGCLVEQTPSSLFACSSLSHSVLTWVGPHLCGEHLYLRLSCQPSPLARFPLTPPPALPFSLPHHCSPTACALPAFPLPAPTLPFYPLAFQPSSSPTRTIPVIPLYIVPLFILIIYSLSLYVGACCTPRHTRLFLRACCLQLSLPGENSTSHLRNMTGTGTGKEEEEEDRRKRGQEG